MVLGVSAISIEAIITTDSRRCFQFPPLSSSARLPSKPFQQFLAGKGAAKGLQPLGLDGDRSKGDTGGDRDGLLYVPKGYRANQPAPLVLMMHGAGAIARQSLDWFVAQ